MTRQIIKIKAVIFAKLKIAIKMNIEIKRPLTICNIGLIIFSETLVMFRRILDDRFELLSVRKNSYSCERIFFWAIWDNSMNIEALIDSCLALKIILKKDANQLQAM